MTIPLFKVYMNEEAPEKVAETLRSGMITQASKVEAFETALEKWFNWPYILTLNSATSGLTLAYRLYDLKSGDQVISTPMTCFATTCGIMNNNLNIVWADTDPNTCNIDLEDVKRKLTKDTKALSFVHWGGSPVNMDEVRKIQKYAYHKFGTKLGVVEDCAHAFGAKWGGKFLGASEHSIAVYSLQAIKHLTTGDGGLIFLPNKEMYDRAKLLRWYGIDRERRSLPGTDFRLEPDIPEPGFKYHMNDIAGTLGLANLSGIAVNLDKARENAQYYDEMLTGVDGITTFLLPEQSTSARWIYTFKIENGERDRFSAYMNENDVVVSQVHARNDKHSCTMQFETHLPNLDILESKIISIPVGWWVTNEDREKISNLIHNFCAVKRLSSDYMTGYHEIMIQHIGDRNQIAKIDTKLFDQVYVLKVGTDVVATAKLVIESKAYDPVAHIEDVVVRENSKRRGHGSYLVKHLVKLANEQKVYKIVLSCDLYLLPFYESCGFKKSGISMELRI
jgi:dTDP-4-amino-4,6-dideoxygalactose transaminase/GNAT superfamily N-acetyltransferase